MVKVEDGYGWQPIAAPLHLPRDEDRTRFDNSVNAVSFGFVATAILVSMFLLMAIVERLLGPHPPAGDRQHGDIESQQVPNGKLGHPSPKMTVYSLGVSVLMPGDDIPTYIAHPAPVPCPPECLSWPHHQHSSNLSADSNSAQES